MELHGIPLHIVRKRIKNQYIRIHPEGDVWVSVPLHLSDSQLAVFLEKHWHWIQEKRQDTLRRSRKEASASDYKTGEVHFLWGRPCELVVERSLKKPITELRGRQIYMRVSAKSTRVERQKQLDLFYKEELKGKLSEIVDQYESIVGRRAEQWQFRRMKTRWGSCQIQKKKICLNLQLAEKPVECLEYVLVHELTHLHEPSHNKRFWSLVAQFYPGDVTLVKGLLNHSADDPEYNPWENDKKSQ